MKCIYCSKEKDDSEFSLEHIVPQSMGGTILNSPLLRTNNVCKRCNSLCGLFVDNACLKSWLYQNAKAQSEWKMSNCSQVTPAYIGILEDLSSEEEICDYWVFPKGSQVFCFYPKESKYLTHAGGNPINRSKGKGKVVLVLSSLVTTDLREVKRILNSFCSFFYPYDKYAYNFEIDNHAEIFCYFDSNTEKYKQRVEGAIGKILKAKVIFDVMQVQRFPCKIALALGFNLYGYKFLDTEYAEELKKGLWYKTGEDNGVRGTSFILSDMNQSSNKSALEIFQVGRANTLAIMRLQNILSCTMSIYGKLSTIVICDDITKTEYDNVSMLDKGIFFAWHPQLGISTGQMSLSDLINHKKGVRENGVLKILEAS